MKKILIFSLCGLFSFSSTLYGTYGTDVAPDSMNLGNFSVPALPRANEMLVAPVVDANVLASVKKAPQDTVCWRDAKLKATLGNIFLWVDFVEKRLLFNTVTRQIQEFSPAQEKVFTQLFTQLCESKGEVTVAAIANKTQKATYTVREHINELGDLLDGIGVEISHIRGKIQTNMGAVSIEPPDSTRTVSIPLTKKREIIGPSETAEIWTYENVNKVHAPGSGCPSKISYFIDINGELQRIGYYEARLLLYLSKLERNTLITTGDIIAQSTVNGEKAFTENTVYPYISRVRPWLRTCGLEIKTITGEGYKIQEIGGANQAIEGGLEIKTITGESYNMRAIGGAKRTIEKRNEPPAKLPCVDTSNNSGQQYQNQWSNSMQNADMQQVTSEKVDPTWQYSQSYFDSNYYNSDVGDIGNGGNWNDNNTHIGNGNEYAQPSSESQYGGWLDSDEALSNELRYSSFLLTGEDSSFEPDND